MKKFQQIFSIFLIIVLLGLYIATLITGIMASESSHLLFNFSVTMTFVVPVLLYAMLMFSKLYKNSVNNKINKQGNKASDDNTSINNSNIPTNDNNTTLNNKIN